MTWREAARVADVPAGGSARFTVGAHDYLVFRSEDDRFYASDLSCTHRYAEMDGTGALVGTLLTCVSHGATFDLARSGAVVSPALTRGATPDLRTFPARVEDGVVLVDVPDGDEPPKAPWD